MELDFTTIVATAAFVAGMSGAFLLVAGGQLQQARPTTIWGVANIFVAFGMMLVMQGREYDLALLMLMAAAALAWIAAARFNKKMVPLVYLVAGLAVWAFMALGPWDIAFGISSATFLAIAALYFLAGATELWRGRAESLPGRWPVLFLVLVAAAASLVGAAELWSLETAPRFLSVSAMWVVYVTGIAFTVGTAVFFVAMTKERSVAFHTLASLTDPLTGLANRTALTASGAAEITEAQLNSKSVAVVLFDLDDFKEFNEKHGHRAGDAVLRQFADIAVSCIRASDLIGRIGGEEFAAIIPGVDADGAMTFAERVRKTFADNPAESDDDIVEATVSAGVAVVAAHEFMPKLDELLDRADRALYQAKAAGPDSVRLYREPNLMEREGAFVRSKDHSTRPSPQAY